jgi:folate-binding Fe-S cluster repair protein YgfZ
VFVTATARTLDLASAYVMPNQVLLSVSPSMKQPLLERMDKYIFPGDNVQVGLEGRPGQARPGQARAAAYGM